MHFGLEPLLAPVLYVTMFATFFASVFWRPHLGIYLMVFTLPLQTGRYQIQVYPLGAQFLDILLLGTILGLLIQGRRVVPRTDLNGILLIFAIFCYLSLWEGSFFINAPLPLSIGDERVSAWKNYVEMFLFALVVAASIREKAQVKVVLVLMAISILLVNRANFNALSSRDLTHFSYDVRDAGPLGYAGVNGLAALEAMAASFLLGMFSFVRQKWVKAAILLMLATCGYCLLFSFSRGGYLGFVAGLVTLGLFRSRWMLVAAAVLVLGWQALLPPAVQERILMTTQDSGEGQQLDASSELRIDLWKDAMESFKRNPLTGTGFQTFGYFSHAGGLRDTHNYYVKVLAEMGIAGLMVFLWLLWKLLRTGTALYSSAQDPFWRGFGLSLTAVLISAFIMNFFGDRWTYQQVDGYIWILVGCALRGLMIAQEDKPEAEQGAKSGNSFEEEPQLASV